jgi:hypothetical protein
MRTVLITVLLVATALAASSGSASSGRQLPEPDPGAIGLAAGLSSPQAAPVVDGPAPAAFPSWGARYLTAGGDRVHVLVSNAYTANSATAEHWAAYLASLEHGDEIDRVTIAIQTADQMRVSCGSAFALACYRPDNMTMYIPADPPAADTSVEGLVAHEYAHHIEATRSNAPWSALDYGPKNWATYQGVCWGVQAGFYFPGAESPGRYDHNPGEGFAEAYRILNQHRLGLAPRPWVIVLPRFYPDEGALSAIDRDVLSPWAGNTVSTSSGRFGWGGSGRTTWRRPAGTTETRGVRMSTVSTPLDGNATVTIWTAGTLRARLDVTDGNGTLATVTSSGGTDRVTVPICGVRGISARVTRLGGTGSFTVSVATP